MSSNTKHSLVRGISVGIVFVIISSLDIGKNADNIIVLYVLPASITAIAALVTVYLVDRVFKKSK